jgi:drug/metabolite transporter superfamily protein YnfA
MVGYCANRRRVHDDGADPEDGADQIRMVILAIFAWLLTLHPAAAGRVYAAYGGVYIAVALIWLWKVDAVRLTRWDVTGAAVALLGMGIIVWGGWRP